jgi:hypothetical protein
MEDPDVRYERYLYVPMPEVSPTHGIRVFDSAGRELIALPPSVKLYAYLVARLSSELQRMTSRATETPDP